MHAATLTALQACLCGTRIHGALPRASLCKAFSLGTMRFSIIRPVPAKTTERAHKENLRNTEKTQNNGETRKQPESREATGKRGNTKNHGNKSDAETNRNAGCRPAKSKARGNAPCSLQRNSDMPVRLSEPRLPVHLPPIRISSELLPSLPFLNLPSPSLSISLSILTHPVNPIPPPQKKSVLIRSFRLIRVNSPQKNSPPESLRALLLCGLKSFGNANSFVRSAFRKFPRNPPLSPKKKLLKNSTFAPFALFAGASLLLRHPYPSSPHPYPSC